MDKDTGLVFDIQRYSIHDGPGIRTLVFMKGCPLRCKWCANPEGLTQKKSIMFSERNCYGCGACVSACTQKSIRITDGNIIWDKEKCTGCLKCAKACGISHARRICGTEYTVSELLDLIDRDSIYFQRSQGGVTVGGGEPMMQAEFVSKLLKSCHEELCINTAIETSSYASWERASMIYKHTDVIQTDIKHMDEKEHMRLTGVSNRPVLENIRRAAEMLDRKKQTMIIRIPVIPGMNDSEENITATAHFVKSLKTIERMELLPYHNLGEMKYKSVSDAEDYKLHGLRLESDEYMEFLRKKVEECGVRAVIGGL